RCESEEQRRRGDCRCSRERRVRRIAHSRRGPHQSRITGVGGRRQVSRPRYDHHLSLRRWRPLRARGRKLAKDGLQKRPRDGRRFQSLESSRFTDNEIARSTLVFALGTFLTWPRSAVSNNRHISTFVSALWLALVAFLISGSTTNPADIYLPQLKD